MYTVKEDNGNWVVDEQGEACWYFFVADRVSGEKLAGFFNEPSNKKSLEALRHEVGAEKATLKLWLHGLRDKGVAVTTFAYKGTGILEKNNVLE
ncbi:hypothetical protein KKQ10_27185 [Pseudomonas sp. MG-9]|uniref:hypothetical protein n=1 Tax=Pseudomonas TaxID=286 RepID=UPI001C007B10|nr:hypothetical protein [Pseudomonas sp. MG-9]MBT9268567.1 hypothetical protein [Pseudomonas sp. MG-9]